MQRHAKRSDAYSLRDTVAACRLILPRDLTAGETRVEAMGAAEGTVGTVMFGGGGAGTLAALPTPLGSLTELFRPPALPTPLIPLTPASWAKDVVAGAVSGCQDQDQDQKCRFAEHEYTPTRVY